jgi:hypothetical protein
MGNGVPNALVGDGYCNDETNNAACHYDGGDCCGIVNTNLCTECNCYLNVTCAAGFPPPSVGDGYCNDETNIAECMFDGLDCCGYDRNNDGDDDEVIVDTTLCIECECHGMYIITVL